MSKYSVFSDAELNEAAAGAMRWKLFPHVSMWKKPDGTWRDCSGWNPASDLRHSAEFAAYVSSKYPGFLWSLRQTATPTGVIWIASLWRNDGRLVNFDAASVTRAHAETEAGLLALGALEEKAKP